MTSKEVVKELIKEIDKVLQTGKSLRSYRIYQYLDMLEQPQPTLSECIKEWEEKGWKVTISKREIEIRDTKTLTYISIDKKDKAYWCSAYLPFEEHYLLTKTLKALEEMKDE